MPRIRKEAAEENKEGSSWMDSRPIRRTKAGRYLTCPAQAQPTQEKPKQRQMHVFETQKKKKTRRDEMRFATLNTRTLATEIQRDAIDRMLTQLDVDVAALQETRFKEIVTIDCTGYTIYAGSADARGVGGVGFALRKALAPRITHFASISNRLAYIKLRTDRDRHQWLVSAHAPTEVSGDMDKDRFYDELLSLVRKIPRNDDLFIGMDANATFSKEDSSPCLGRWHIAGDPSDNGHRLLELCETAGIAITSTFPRSHRRHQFTWYGAARLSEEEKQRRGTKNLRNQIDYVLTRLEDAHRMRKCRAVRKVRFDSDHRPVVATLAASRPRTSAPPSKPPRIDSSKLKEEDVKHHFQQSILDKTIHAAIEGDQTADGWTKAVYEAAEESLPKIRTGTAPKSFSEKATALYTELCQARNDGLHRKCRTLRSHLRKQIVADRDDIWEDREKELKTAWDEKNVKKVYTLLKKYSGRLSAPVKMVEAEGVLVAGDEALNTWRSYFDGLLNQPPPASPELHHHRRPAYGAETSPPSPAEIQQAIRKMKTGKAAGDDGITAEMIKCLPSCAQHRLEEIIRDIWTGGSIPDSWRNAVIVPLHKKGPKTNPANYRGISLLRITFKLLERLIVERILRHREGTARDEQSGFRPGRSTIDQINNLRLVLERHRDHGKELHIAFLDFRAAFDSPDRDRLFRLVEADGVPARIVDLLRDMNRSSTATVRTASGTTASFDVKTGVRQGSVTGPILFNFAIDDIMARVQAECPPAVRLHPSTRRLLDLDYADDLALIAESTEDLQIAIDKTADISSTYGLRLRPDKCKHMWLNTKPDRGATVYGEEMELVTEFCYLGSIVDSRGDLSKDVVQRCRKASAAFSTLWKCLWSTKASPEAKLRIYIAGIRPVMLYGCETWAASKAILDRLDANERRFFRRMLGLFWPNQLHNHELYARIDAIYRSLTKGKHYRLSRPSQEVVCRRLRLFGHIIRRPQERICHRILLMEPHPDWKRAPGRKRESWKDAVKKSLDDFMKKRFRRDELLRRMWNSPGSWIEVVVPLANDRVEWNRTCAIVSGCG